jgi:phage shock protein PspC (stress-responsive transcriptional regulator)
MNRENGTKVLVRNRKDRLVAGVCAGAADYFGIDVTLIRVIVAVVSVLTGGAGILAYLAAWVIISLRPLAGPPTGEWIKDTAAGTAPVIAWSVVAGARRAGESPGAGGDEDRRGDRYR